ncbi:MAG: NUDIX hydrolase [Clostridia bacterium]|nr:NUDIX hydrolase [Clostridia bacterium]MBR6619614.1 NUDIX hydrolase [Clostridia bacterium]
MDTREVTVFKNTIFRGKIINLRVDIAGLPNGKEAVREVVEHSGGVTVAALTDDMELIFVRQFRYPYMEEVLELPAGKLEKGENPLEAGKRELREEGGVIAGQYINLGEFYPTPGYTNEIIYLYGARDLVEAEQDLDDDEFLNVERIPLSKAVDMVLNNEIKDGKTQAAVMKLAMLIERKAK